MTDILSIEELYQRVRKHPHSDYVLEAVRCFNAQAYRACIIMTCNAVFDTVRHRMNELKAGEVSRAKEVVGAINAAVDSGRTFEGALVTKLRETRVIPAVETDALGEILNKRNNAAHPSNASATAKDAYYVFEKAVTYFLSEQARPLRFAIDILIRDIYSDGFFTDPVIDNVARKVDEEISAFDEADYYLLINDLKKRLVEDKGNEDSKALWFLLGLLESDRPKLHSIIAKEFFAKKGFTPEQDAFLVDMCVVRPPLLSMISGQNRERLDHTFAKFAESLAEVSAERTVRSPTALLSALTSEFEDPGIEGCYPKTVEVALRRFWSHSDLGPLFQTRLKDRLFKHVLEEAEHTDAAAEQDLILYLEREDAALATALSRAQIEKLFVAAMTPHCRKDLREMRDRGFDRIPRLRSVMSTAMSPISGWRRTSPYLIWEGNDLILRDRELAQP
ncbi:hypothetical protein CO662_22015 [Rhizobium anhuiense]|uniref:DUF4145 domain-containing protein n=1 Tax=Rhizobium anhuiense TaxID=1184720 RepID=A0ABX4J3J6_9HYPH|nr:DUF4145 domain-containing protein [Rhizobium anhuiense]PDS49750.1 hypothetical protein CO662_22015 [Rhizobium anhuiense]